MFVILFVFTAQWSHQPRSLLKKKISHGGQSNQTTWRSCHPSKSANRPKLDLCSRHRDKCELLACTSEQLEYLILPLKWLHVPSNESLLIIKLIDLAICKCQWRLPLLLAQVVERLLQRGREARHVDADVLLGEVELEDLVPAAAVDGVGVPHRRVLRPQRLHQRALLRAHAVVQVPEPHVRRGLRELRPRDVLPPSSRTAPPGSARRRAALSGVSVTLFQFLTIRSPLYQV